MAPQQPTDSTASGQTTNPAAIFQQMQHRIQQLEVQLASTTASGEPRLEVAKIPTFDGGDNGTTVQAFITQARARLLYNPSINTEEAKVRYVAGYLHGPALNWFEPTMRDHLENDTDNRDTETTKVFGNFDYFAKRLHETFGNPDEKRTAERRLGHLKQKESASKYAAEFQQIASKTGWDDDDALMAAFYQGLRDDVKDELSREERPGELHVYISKAVKIRNRLYERLEKMDGKTANWTRHRYEERRQAPRHKYQPNSGKRREYRSTAFGTHPGAMDIDVARKAGPAQGTKCYNCGIDRHFAKDCRKPRQKRLEWKGPVPEGQRQARAAVKDTTAVATMEDSTSHGLLNWTFCYDDSCIIHRSEKDGSGWYPKKPGKKTLAMGWKEPMTEEEMWDEDCTSSKGEEAIK